MLSWLCCSGSKRDTLYFRYMLRRLAEYFGG